MCQVKRIYKKYIEKGAEGLNHGLMGKAGNYQKVKLREEALKLYRENFVGWGPTLAAEQMAGEESLTEFGKVCKNLGIGMIYAGSPQAKGRVERYNGVHQDRLIKLMEYKEVKTIEDANKYLREEYWDRHNAKFSRMTEVTGDKHILLADEQNIDDIVSYYAKRVVSRDNVVRYKNRKFQIYKNDKISIRPGDSVTIKRWLDGSIHIYKKNIELTYNEINHRGDRVAV